MSEPVIMLGRCVMCKTPVRIELPAGATVYPSQPAATIQKAGVAIPWCSCRAGKRCEQYPSGLPKCHNQDCAGHPQTAIKLATVKVTYKPEITCGGSCWAAKGAGCACSCRGKNHGGMWALSR